MSNMSYCRFRNTDSDLADCEAALESLLNLETDAVSPLSTDEREALHSLAKRCQNIVAMLTAHNPDDGDPLELDLEEVIDSMAAAFQEAYDDLEDDDDEEG